MIPLGDYWYTPAGMVSSRGGLAGDPWGWSVDSTPGGGPLVDLRRPRTLGELDHAGERAYVSNTGHTLGQFDTPWFLDPTPPTPLPDIPFTYSPPFTPAAGGLTPSDIAATITAALRAGADVAAAITNLYRSRGVSIAPPVVAPPPGGGFGFALPTGLPMLALVGAGAYFLMRRRA